MPPTLPCPTQGCGGWTNTRRGKWYKLTADFSLVLDPARLAKNQLVCHICNNIDTGQSQALHGRIRRTAELRMDYLLAATGLPPPSPPSPPSSPPPSPPSTSSPPPLSSSALLADLARDSLPCLPSAPSPCSSHCVATSHSSVRAAVPTCATVTPAFFALHRSRSSVTDRLLLQPCCSSYLAALVAMVTTIVGLDLGPDSLHSTRVLDSPSCTPQQWAAVLRADNRVPVTRYAECAAAGWSAKQVVFARCALGELQVYLDHPVFPSGLTEMGLSGWAVEVERKKWRRTVDDQPPLAASGLNSSHPYREDGERERRQRVQVPVNHSESCLGLSDADKEEKRADNFYSELSLPRRLAGVSRYIHSTDCPTLYNFGPISTRTHHDGVGGWSQLVEGWKVFMWWQPQHSRILRYDTVEHFFHLDSAKDVVSFQWALLGPGCSISLPADVPHCVVSLSSSLLFTWATDNGPSRLCRLLGYILAGDIHDPVWLFDWSHKQKGNMEHWLSSELYVDLLQAVFRHAAVKMRAWQEAGETDKVQATARAWQQTRADGMDEAFSRPFHPRGNSVLSPTASGVIRDMYREMNSCMQQWALRAMVRVDVNEVMRTVHTRHPDKRKRLRW